MAQTTGGQSSCHLTLAGYQLALLFCILHFGQTEDKPTTKPLSTVYVKVWDKAHPVSHAGHREKKNKKKTTRHLFSAQILTWR